MGKVFLEYEKLLTAFPSFNCLRQTLSSSKDNWLAVEHSLRQAREKWGRLVKLLRRDGVDIITEGIFYVAVVQVVLLFGSETLVITPQMDNYLEDFHHSAVRRLAVMVPKHQQDGTWLYPPIGVALATVGLDEIGVHISRHQNMVAQYISTRPIMDFFMLADGNL